MNIKKFENFDKSKFLDEHIGWVVGVLESWATTYEDRASYTAEDDEPDDGYDNIMELAKKLKDDTYDKSDFNEILFHLWQSIGQEE